ncbi:pumilio-family RNA binding repeat domain-containing protein [Ditylenchus destructor]|uniref:Pumilio-family RNA binding repeat domain-containing protein n=1 Tax=Ditylenchus destructor TaxID=166010 RepID=A0AAD4R808_9BILA|nr:pumilio-family RNA binding repeat domain-containing protein [Ditylenchus destructor]
MLKNVEQCRSRDITRTSMVDFIKSSYLCNSVLQKTNNDAQFQAYAEKSYKDNRAIEPLENDLDELEHNLSDLYLGYTSEYVHSQERFYDDLHSDMTKGFASINFVIIPASNLLDDFRKGLLPGLQLKHIKMNVVDFARDQDGSRFVQDKLGHASEEVKQMIFYELYPYAYSLMTNMFGNHIVQKYLEEGSSEQKRYLIKQMKGNVITLALDMYGCYVLQKAIEFSDSEGQDALFAEMKGNVMKLVVDKQGNHAIQKIVECIDSDRWQFILDVFVDKQYDRVRLMSIHPYGCRVIQCILQCCKPKQKRPILDQLYKNIHFLVTDQYGNYVIQQVLECSSWKDKKRIIHELKGKVLTYSLQRSASHVVEKSLRHGSLYDRRDLIAEVCSKKSNSLVRMMKDSCANYVIQTMLDVADTESRKHLMAVIKNNINELRQNEHAKHIVSNWFLECWNAEWELKQNSVTSATFYNLIANKPSWICFIQDPQQWQTNIAAILAESCSVTHDDTVLKKAKFKIDVDVGQKIVSNQTTRAAPSIARWRKDHIRKGQRRRSLCLSENMKQKITNTSRHVQFSSLLSYREITRVQSRPGTTIQINDIKRLFVEPVCVDFIRDILIRMNPVTGQVSTRLLQERVMEALSPSEVPPLCDGLGSPFPYALQPLVDFKQYAEGDAEEPHYATPDEIYAECNHEHPNQAGELPSNSAINNQLSKSTESINESSKLVDYGRRLENASKMFSTTKFEHLTGNSDCECNVQSTRHYYQIANVEINHMEIGEDKFQRTRHYCANLAKSLAKCRSLGSLQDMA